MATTRGCSWTCDMARFVLVLVVAVCVLAACGGGSTPPTMTAPTMTVLSPNGGETWFGGSTQTVTWATTDHEGNVDIEYSTDGGTTWLPLASDTPDDGSEDVAVPSVSVTTVRVQVSAADGDPSAALAPADASDADFEIQALVLTSPNGGELWLMGFTEAVTWDAGAFAGNVDIDISTDGGSTWSALAAGTANDGTEDVTVPATATRRARVRVGAADGDPSAALAPYDASDANFQIPGPSHASCRSARIRR